MAATGKKISELTIDSNITGDELLPIFDSDGKTKSVKLVDAIKALMNNTTTVIDPVTGEEIVVAEIVSKQDESQNTKIENIETIISNIQASTEDPWIEY